MAYQPLLAAALSGASVAQLAHWRKAGTKGTVLVPEVSAERPIFYSFRDLVALRTFVYIRRDTSLQKIRVAIGNLRNLGEKDHLSEYRLVADADSIFLVQQDDAFDLVKRPGQQVIAEMSDVLRPFLNRRDVEVPALYNPRRHVTVDPSIRAGFPVIAGTRVPYDNVVGLLADGVAPDRIATYYPAVSAAAATDAEDFAKYVETWRRAGDRAAG